MAHNLSRLFDQIKLDLGSNPRLSLAALSLTLKVERHTIEKAVRVMNGGRFRDLRNELLLRRTKALLSDDAILPIKEIAFLLGYESPQAFAHFVRGMSGSSPSGLRSRRRGMGWSLLERLTAHEHLRFPARDIALLAPKEERRAALSALADSPSWHTEPARV